MKSNKLKAVGVAALGLATSVASSMASAAIDISADTASAKTDIATAGGLIVGVVVAVAAISWIRRVIR